MPSLGDIASKAALSRAAVSMALRNHPRISASTRLRVQSIANRLGWRPNPLLAGAMATIRAGQPAADRPVLAWVTAHPRRDAWRRVPFFARCFEGARSRAFSAGYMLKHFWLGDAGNRPDRLSDILYARGIPGLIIAPLPKPGALEFSWDRFCAVTIGHSLTAPRLHRAIGNNYASAREVFARLAASGRLRIGLVLSADQDHRVDRMWSAGYLVKCQEHGMRNPRLLFLPTKLTERSFRSWAVAARPDAVIGIDERIPRWLQRGGTQGAAWANLNLPDAESGGPGIFQNAHGIGACAMDLLAGQLMRPERGLPSQPTTVMIDGLWVAGPQGARPSQRPQARELPRAFA
jgi:LacI family transcriptional regulator